MDPQQPIAAPLRFQAALGAAALTCAVAFLLVLSWFKLDGVDLGYHLAYGRHFLETGHIVDRDPFLLPEVAQPFVNANWGSQVIMAWVERAAGAAGLVALRSALITIVFVSIALMVLRQARSPLWIAVAILLAAVGGYERFSLRPELFSYAIMSVMLAILLRGAPTRGRVALLVILQLSWVNVHSYFLVGLILTGSFAFEEFVRWIRNGDDKSRQAIRLLSASVLLQIAVCFVNPWHVHGAAFPIETLGYLSREQAIGQSAEPMNAGPWAQISEFHSPLRYFGDQNFGRTIDAYFVLLAAALIATVIWLVRGRMGPALVVVLFVLMSVQMRRNIAQLAFVTAPLFCLALSQPELRSRVSRVASAGLALMVVGLGVWWTIGIVSGRFYYTERRITRQFGAGYSETTFPKDAVQWLAAQDALKPNLYVDYFTSSNTLPWLPTRFKLFVDTNTFAYRDKVLGEAFDLGLGRLDHQAFFDRKEVNVVLLHCGSDTQMLVRALARDFTNWALVYFDQHAVIFVRRIIEHVPIIRSSARDESNLDPNTWVAANMDRSGYRALSLTTAAAVPISLGWNAAAAFLLNEAVRIAPDFHEAWYYLGTCEGNLGNAAAKSHKYGIAAKRYEQAIRCFDEVLKLRPDHAGAKAYRHDTAEALRIMPRA